MREPDGATQQTSSSAEIDADSAPGISRTQSSWTVRDQAQREGARDFVVEAAKLCHDRHCEDVVLFDLRGLSNLTDYLLIASGTSDRQISAVSHEIADLAAEHHGLVRLGSQRDESTSWVVVDLVDAIVHLFEPATRAHYDLEMMWDDAPRLDWRRQRDAAKPEIVVPVRDVSDLSRG
ncbi:MAG: ribosome silencing factor [Phycisphaeraceae bacterium]|nr:ribosome silencing factor [Phycisphaeraceae bacterium]